MDCSEFEGTLADLLAAPAGRGDVRIPRLREHAATCPACAGSADLVDFASLSAEERDPVDDPGESYWSDFGARLAARLTGEESRRRRAVAVGAGLAAAAIVAAVLLVGAFRRGAAPEPVAVSRPDVAPVAEPPTQVASSGTAAPPAGPFRSATPSEPRPVDDEASIDDDLAGEFGGVEPLDVFLEDDAADLFPTADDMDPADAKRFLEWLTQEESRVRGGAA